MEKGYVQIYTGDGKGKTTAALGLALRAAGRGLRVRIVQFMKGRDTGEIRALAALPAVILDRVPGCEKFHARMTPEEKRILRDNCRGMLERITGWLSAGDADIVILDEIMGAIACGAVELSEALSLIDRRPDRVELVMTGRRAPAALVDRANLVTEMVPVKHYFDKGVRARKGIEY